MHFILIIALVTIAVALLMALLKGGDPEKSMAVIILVWLAVDQLYHLLVGGQAFWKFDFAHFFMDSAAFVAVLTITINANRIWPFFAASAQLIAVCGYLVALLGFSGTMQAHWAMTQLPFLVEMVALGVGTIAHSRRSKRLGNYGDWLNSQT